MKILYRRCAALDVHNQSVRASIREAHGHGEVEIQRQTFGTFSDDLERLRNWLKEHKVRRVAMESTGVYWIPVWNVLERPQSGLELMLVNPTLVKALPGCKTDSKDADRIAELHQYGLLRGSFIPPRPIRRLRDLVRRRTHLVQDKNQITNRIERLLQTANVKLGSVASNILGMSGHKMLWALAGGESNPVRLASLALGKLKDKEADLVRALNGRFDDHFRYLLRDLLEDWDRVESKVGQLGRRVEQELEAQGDVVERLCTIPGVERITAWTILAEIGLDMRQFPDAGHLASWAGLCPGNQESAGKRLSGKTRKGNRYLRRALVQVAWAIAHSKDGNFLTAVFFRIARRRGLKKAALAVAHRVLVIAYYILRDGGVYRELGRDYFDRLHPERTVKRLVQRLENLGLDVALRRRSAPIAGAEPARPVGRSRRAQAAVQPAGISLSACRKCARWGIPCIHVRPRVPRPPEASSAPESTS
jgi:transposase